MSHLVNPIDVLVQAYEMRRESVERLREMGIGDVDKLYARVMEVLESENEPKMKELEEMLEIETGGLIEFADFLENGQVSRATLDKYDLSGRSIGYLRRENNRIYFEEEKGSK